MLNLLNWREKRKKNKKDNVKTLIKYMQKFDGY